jgi:ribosomal protein S18 acetylase RimI-like enzyme
MQNLQNPIHLNASDYDRVLVLWQAAGLHIKPAGRDARDSFQRQLASGLQIAIGIETEQGELVGITLATHDGRKGWINRLAVHPDYRRQGVAKTLITAAEEALQSQGMDVIAALIEPENNASFSLFMEAGYTDWPGLHYVSKRNNEDS